MMQTLREDADRALVRTMPLGSSMRTNVLMLACALGCGAPSSKAPPSAPVPAATTPMARHDLLAIEVRDAIASGDRAAAQLAAAALAAVDVAPRAPRYDQKIAGMHAAATRVANATDISLALEFGELARTCANCHALFGGPTTVSVQAPPAPAPGAVRRMTRHAWALEQLWIGIVFNSEAPWLAGAEVLADPAVSSDELTPNKTTDVEIDALAASVQRIGRRAKVEYGPKPRAHLYGELLSTCARCHERTGGGARL